MSVTRRGVLLMASAGGISGCGFHPVYGPRAGQPDGAQGQLGRVQVALIPERSGQLVRQELQARLDHGDALAKRYELSVSFSLAGDAIGTQQDSTVSRLRLVGTANWQLKTLTPPQSVVTTGVARALDGVNILDQQYFESDLAGETATRRIAGNVADQIASQLAIYFARQPVAS